MRPSRYLLRLILAWFAAGVVVFAFRVANADSLAQEGSVENSAAMVSTLEYLWRFAAVYLAVFALVDYFRQRNFRRVSVRRELPHSLALGVPAHVELYFQNDFDHPLQLDVVDLLPQAIEAEDLPLTVTLAARGSKKIRYPITPVQRGEAVFAETCLRISSRWKLWQRLVKKGEPQAIKVYPNFAPIASSAAIGLEHQIAQLGIHLQQRRGEGSDFHQLREFRVGDALRQIDWKATARYRKPISREYQDERDQDIVFLLDCGRRLRNKDDHISHFDHALNALLLTCYVALRQGDAVGMLSFAGEERWMPPVKGPARINNVLNQLYDLHSSTTSSDYLKAAERLMEKYAKRSLVILITKLREEDMDDLTQAAQLLSKKHILMVASLRDLFVDQLLKQPVKNFADALAYCGTTDFTRRRKRLLAKMQGQGVIMTDSLPHNLHVDLVNEYFKLKRSGRL